MGVSEFLRRRPKMSRRALRRCEGGTCCGVEVDNDSRINDDHFIQKSISDLSLWKTFSEESRLVHIRKKRDQAEYLREVLGCDWDVNKMLDGGQGAKMTALCYLKYCTKYSHTNVVREKLNIEVLNELVGHCQNVGINLDKELQGLLQVYLEGKKFYPEHLDLLFTHRVHIDPDYQGSTLSDARIRSVNTLIWLIRHGAYWPSFMFYHVYISSPYKTEMWHVYNIAALEVLLQVGIKPVEYIKVRLGEVESIIQDYLSQGNSGDQGADIMNETSGDRSFSPKHSYTMKDVFPVHRQQQMAHLREFSNHSLDVYPEERNMNGTTQEHWEQILMRISTMLHFLNQPHTLQWHCRVCLRESLVSLSPSVIRTLSVPASLKRYILCHEIGT